ncbi:MAG: VWA domain-containing protein [Burkholderiales bacterium]|nr:VWA domain-containing protein [Burkholderiales bacterium]
MNVSKKSAKNASNTPSHKPSNRALAMLASIIGRRHGIEVVFDAGVQTAATDGKKIYLPLISDLGNDDHVALIEGLLDHEAMHVRFTDFSVKLGTYGPIVATLTNLFEDVWGEREQAVVYPGCARNIRKSMQVMIEMGLYKGPDADISNEAPASILVNWLINGLLARWYGLDELQVFTAQYRVHVDAVLGKDLADEIWTIACKVDGISSTKESQKLALSIVNLLKKKAKEQPEQGQPQQGQPQQGQPQQGQPQQGQSQQNQSQRGQSQQGQSQQGQSQQGQSEQDQSEQGQSAQGQPSDAPSSPSALESILSATADQIAAGDMGTRICAALASEKKGGRASNIDPAELAVEMSGSAGGQMIRLRPRQKVDTALDERSRLRQEAAFTASRPIAVRLGNRLEDVLQARTDSVVLHKRSGRKLSSRRTPGIALGKLDVFRNEEEGLELDTAVSLLVDASGSMSDNFEGYRTGATDEGSRIVSALAVSIAASLALDKHSIPFEVACFGQFFVPQKLFDEPFRTLKTTYLAEYLGGTLTGCAVAKATTSLLSRPESRKVLVVITDGDPDNERTSAAMINECRMLGVEIALVFIGNDGVFFEDMLKKLDFKVSRATDASNLAKQFFEAVESCI